MYDTSLITLIVCFVNVCVQARSMREVAASGGLTDEQRRERAAEMAMRLCRLIGLEEGSGSDEEEGKEEKQ